MPKPKHLRYICRDILLLRRSIGFSEECMGLHYGNIHEANLGDGDGRKGEQFLARQYYFPVWGTCWESFAGTHVMPMFAKEMTSVTMTCSISQVAITSELGSRTVHSRTVALGFSRECKNSAHTGCISIPDIR